MLLYVSAQSMVQSFESITLNFASQEDFESLEIIQEQLSVLAERVSQNYWQEIVLNYFFTLYRSWARNS